jgi:4-hydroxyphenylacetate 3-monooxygenase
VTTHPAFRGGVHSLAALYDLQWQQPEVTLFDSPTTGKKVARSFMLPRTQAELRSVTRAMQVWQDYTHGMMGRSPDYISRAITGYAAGAAFRRGDPRFGERGALPQYMRENDLA